MNQKSFWEILSGKALKEAQGVYDNTFFRQYGRLPGEHVPPNIFYTTDPHILNIRAQVEKALKDAKDAQFKTRAITGTAFGVGTATTAAVVGSHIKTASRAHYYLPGIIAGAIAGSQFKDTDPSTGETSINPANVGLGAAVGLAGGHIMGTKFPKWYMTKKILERQNLTHDAIGAHLKQVATAAAEGAPSNTGNYIQNNLLAISPNNSYLRSRSKEVIDAVKDRAEILTTGREFSTPQDIEEVIKKLPNFDSKDALSNALNVASQKIINRMKDDYNATAGALHANRPEVQEMGKIKRILSHIPGFRSQAVKDLKASRQDMKNYANAVNSFTVDANRAFVGQ